MSLVPGTKLGPYEIVAPIGAGGMGEVYRARDSRLGREVAVKVLPEEMAQDTARLRRFEQEARSASALNHPGILTVHDFGSHDGRAYLVTELLAGNSVRALLEDGPLAAKRTIDLAVQIAKGLAAAHDQGIVHRDLKPENLFLTHDGVAKILDFGLARFVRPGPAGADRHGGATRVETSAGILLGTAGYMAPEQVRGERVDERSDLFSLGVVLHEMLVGANPFRRDSVVESLNAILKEEAPELPARLAGANLALSRIVARLLQKEPVRRFHSAHDLVFALQELTTVASASTAIAASPVFSAHSRWRWSHTIAAVALVAAGSLGGWLLTRADPPSPQTPIRFQVPPPEGGRFRSGQAERHDFALAPDGQTLAFAASVHGVVALYLRDLSNLEPRVLVGTEGAYSPFWSPDGSTIAYFAGGKLKRVARSGGPVQVICAVQGANTGSWGSAGSIVFSQAFGADNGLFRVAAASGNPEKLEFGGMPRWLEFLPDGHRFLYWDRDLGSFSSRIHLGDLRSRRSRPLLDVQSQVRYAAPGWLLYLRAGVLVAQRFDAASGQLAGEPTPLAANVSFFFNGWASFSVGGGNALAYQVQSPPQPLLWLDRHGRELERVGPEARYLAVRLSPDGTSAVASRSDPASAFTDLWVIDLTHGGATRLTDEPNLEWSPAWSPDGERIAYTTVAAEASSSGAQFTVAIRRAADGVQVAKLPPSASFRWVRGWRSSGLFVDQAGARGDFDIWRWPDFDAEPRPLVQTEFSESGASPSPDGRWLAFFTSESGTGEIQIVRADAPGRRVRVSEGASSEVPRWRADGRELFYVSAEQWLTAVSIGGGETLEIGKREALFPVTLVSEDSFDVAADGQRFLVTATRPPSSLPIEVALDWQAALPER